MHNYISKLLGMKNKTISKEQNNNNTVSFEVDEDKKIDVILQLNDLSIEAASQFGFFLFLLNEGYYVQTIIDILSEMCKEGGEKAIFSQRVISTWSQKILENDKYNSDINNNDPIIKPTQFHVSHK